MKKLTLIAAVAIAAISAKAAALDWNINAASAQEGFNVYLMTSLATDGYANEQAISDASIDSASIANLGRKYGTGVQMVEGIAAAEATDMYAIIVDPSDSGNYIVKSLGDLSGLVYDTNNQESSPGIYGQREGDPKVADLVSGGTKTAYSTGPIPEPTTVALLALGLAALGLKRKVA